MKHCAMIRAAIVGLGRWGRSLVACVAGKSDDIRFVSAYTRTRATAQQFCREKQIALEDSYEAILRNPDIDAVVLATPHSQHQAQALAAAAARKHVFVEKPLTLDLKSARLVADAARKAGLVLAVGLSRRFHPSIAELRERARDGRLGSIVAMVAQHTTSTAQFIAPDNWRAAADEAPAGAFTAVGVHALDHMIEFAGRVRDVRCITARTYPGASDDTTTVMLRFAGGATGLLFCSVATATNFDFTVYGSNGLAEISRPGPFAFPLRADRDGGADRAGAGAAGRDCRAFRLRHAARGNVRVRPRNSRRRSLSGADRRCAAWHGGVRCDHTIGEQRRYRRRCQLTGGVCNQGSCHDDHEPNDLSSDRACALVLCLGTLPAGADPLPAKVGQCSVTAVKRIESRLEGMPTSGSAISYVNGGYQVSYDMIPAIQASRRGNSVRLCLVSIPRKCPPGDSRGRIYRATNLRTGGTWTAPDSEHSCGGA